MPAIESFEQLLSQTCRAGHRELQGFHLALLRNQYAAHGELPTAIQYLEETRQIWETLGDSERAGLACQNIAGCCEFGLQDLAAAAKYLEMAVAAARTEKTLPNSWAERKTACGQLAASGSMRLQYRRPPVTGVKGDTRIFTIWRVN